MDGDFDASKYDQMMQAVFDQQYYDEEDEEKPEFLDDDEEMLGEGFFLCFMKKLEIFAKYMFFSPFCPYS